MTYRRRAFILGTCLIIIMLAIAVVFYWFRADIALINTADMATYDDNGVHKTSEDTELGDNYTFYYLYCGTGCRGFRVHNQASGAMYNGVISYVYNQENQTEDTVLQDWYGRVYEFEGFLDMTINYHKGYVIFSFHKTEVTGSKTTITEEETVWVPIKPPHWIDLWTIFTR